jgi:hypothetical protein
MRTKKDFYNQINNVTKNGLKTLQELSAQIVNIREKIESGKYSNGYVRTELIPQKDSLKRQMEDVRYKTNTEVQKICAEYTDELRAQDDLDPSLLTDDVKLLKAGVKLTKRDITAMLNRNAGNHTMTQLILRYCKENDIDAGVHYMGNRPIIDNVAMVPYTVETALKWSDRQSTVYERLMGVGSSMDEVFNSED